jgi:peptidoglycan hydrolase-like protein with peptidoglycan-binding domain
MREEQAMRVLILALAVLGTLISAGAATAGPSTTNRDLLAAVNPATSSDEATQQTEDQIGLDEGKRREVQRRLTGLGFSTEANGSFDESTRAAIMRWQVERDHPKTGFLDTRQHDALLAELAPAAHASPSPSGSEKSDGDHPARPHDVHHHRSGGGSGPGGLIGGMMGGLFGRR